MSNSFGNEVSNGTCTQLSRQASLLFAMFFLKDQGKKYGSVFQPDTASSFQKSPALYWQAKTYSALSFDH